MANNTTSIITNQKRISYVDISKCFAIWLVLYGHVLNGAPNIDWETDRFFLFVYSFHMPLFMMLSGFFAEKSFSLSLKDLVRKKFLQLIVPALLFGILAFIIRGILYHNFKISNLLHEEISNFWFLKSLFICYVVTAACWKMGKVKYLCIFVFIMLFLFLQRWDIGLYKTGHMLPFFACGLLLRKAEDKVKKNVLTILLFSFSFFCIVFPKYTLDQTFLAYPFKILNWNSFFDYSMYLVMGFWGSMIIIASALLLDGIIKENLLKKNIRNIGQSTLSIYLWQYIIVEILFSYFFQINISQYLYHITICPIIATLSLIICNKLPIKTNYK